MVYAMALLSFESAFGTAVTTLALSRNRLRCSCRRLQDRDRGLSPGRAQQMESMSASITRQARWDAMCATPPRTKRLSSVGPLDGKSIIAETVTITIAKNNDNREDRSFGLRLVEEGEGRTGTERQHRT